MTEDLWTCEAIRERAVVERYVAGRLSETDTEIFEEHLLACGRCQAEVRLAAGIRVSLAEARAPRRTAGFVAAAAVLAIAASIVALMIGRSGRESYLIGLGAVAEPPVYLGIPVRESISESDSLFNAAMSSYAEGDFQEAEEQLLRVVALDDDALPAHFFLGATLLELDRPGEAEAHFDWVSRRGETPYAQEAHYYRAKALLRLGRGTEALDALGLAASPGGELGQTAAALADSVRAYLSH
jgi:tetratricopeptide (TPR) repeat protein